MFLLGALEHADTPLKVVCMIVTRLWRRNPKLIRKNKNNVAGYRTYPSFTGLLVQQQN